MCLSYSRSFLPCAIFQLGNFFSSRRLDTDETEAVAGLPDLGKLKWYSNSR